MKRPLVIICILALIAGLYLLSYYFGNRTTHRWLKGYGKQKDIAKEEMALLLERLRFDALRRRQGDVGLLRFSENIDSYRLLFTLAQNEGLPIPWSVSSCGVRVLSYEVFNQSVSEAKKSAFIKAVVEADWLTRYLLLSYLRGSLRQYFLMPNETLVWGSKLRCNKQNGKRWVEWLLLNARGSLNWFNQCMFARIAAAVAHFAELVDASLLRQVLNTLTPSAAIAFLHESALYGEFLALATLMELDERLNLDLLAPPCNDLLAYSLSTLLPEVSTNFMRDTRKRLRLTLHSYFRQYWRYLRFNGFVWIREATPQREEGPLSKQLQSLLPDIIHSWQTWPSGQRSVLFKDMFRYLETGKW